MKVKKQQEIQHTNKKKHIIQLFTQIYNINNNTSIMPDQDRCKADKHDSLFVTYTIIDPTFI